MKTIFVSSTFRDMQLERDALQTQVLPVLNMEAEKYGQTVSFCDLRWGVNTSDLESEEGSRKVLDVCLDEIDRCQRPMVVILGERYGWIPSDRLIRDAAERKRMQLESLHISVTALEIEYGALGNDKNLNNSLFYFREIEGDVPQDYMAEDPEHEALITELKERINYLTGGRVKHYSLNVKDGVQEGIKAFCAMVTEDISTMLRPEWQAYEQLTDEERERLIHENYVRDKSALFRARKPLLERLIRKLQDEPLLVIKGEPGSGKSTMISAMAARINDDTDSADVIPYICCLTLNSSTALDIVKSMCRELEKRLSISSPEDELTDGKEWKQYFEDLCREMNASDLKPVVFMIDAVDQLYPDELRDSLAFVPKTLGKGVRMVITCMSDFSTGVYQFEKLLPADRQEQEDIVNALLEDRRREISREVVRAMLNKSSADNPLYLTLLITRMLMMDRIDFAVIMQSGDDMDAIIRRQCQIVDEVPENLEGLAAAVFEVAAERINPNLIRQVSKLLAVSRRGLRMEDIQRAFPEDFNTLDFIHFMHYMSDSFIQREDGRFDFSHKSLRAGILAGCVEQEKLHMLLVGAFKKAPCEDPVRQTEYVYHLLMGRDNTGFLAYIMDNIDIEAEDMLNEPETHKKTLRNAAKRVYEICREDEGEYYLSVLKSVEKHGSGNERGALARFTGLYLYNEFSSGRRMQTVCGRILQKNMKILMKTRGVSGRVMSLACKYLGNAVRNSGEEEKISEAARNCYKEGRQYLEKIPVQERSPEDARMLADLWFNTGLTYENEDFEIEIERKENAFECFEKAEEFYSRAAEDDRLRFDMETVRALCFMKMGEACDHKMIIRYSVRKQAQVYYENARKIQSQLLKEKDSADIRRKMIQCGKSIAEGRLNIGGLDNNREAYRLLEENLSLARKIYADQKELRNLIKLSDCMGDLSLEYSRSFEKHHLVRALQILAEHLPISLQIAKDDGYYGSCAAILMLAAGILARLNVQDHLYHALDFLDAADDILMKNGELPYRSDPDFLMYWNLRGTILAGLGENEKADACFLNKKKSFNPNDKILYAYSELLEIIDIVGNEYRYKVPTQMFQIFQEWSLDNYVRHLDTDIPLDEQEMADETRAMVALMLVGYWAVDENEQVELLEMYRKNEEKFWNKPMQALIKKHKKDPAENINLKSITDGLSDIFVRAKKPADPEIRHLPVRPSYPPFYPDPFRQNLSKEENLNAGRSFLYGKGFGFRPDYARIFLSRAADQGSSEACSEMYMLNSYLLQNPDYNDLDAWKMLGEVLISEAEEREKFENDSSFSRNVIESTGWYIPDVENIIAGYLAAPEAASLISLAENSKKAIEGDPDALCALGNFYRDGKAPLEKPDNEFAVHYWKEAMAKGSDEAKYNLAVLSLDGNDEKLKKEINGWKLLNESAEKGYVEALYKLGLFYYGDADGKHRDMEKCTGYLTDAAEKGSSDALIFLGKILLDEGETEKVLKKVKEAAELGDGNAAYILAHAYENGTYGSKDIEKSMSYYKYGADLDDINCIVHEFNYHLGRKGNIRDDLAALRLAEKLYKAKPTKQHLKNLCLFYNGYGSLPRNIERFIHYRLSEVSEEPAGSPDRESVHGFVRNILKHNSLNIRYNLRETNDEYVSFDALKSIEYSFGSLTFRIPDAYICIQKPITRKREICPDKMIFRSKPDKAGRCVILLITQEEAHVSDIGQFTGALGMPPQRWYKEGRLIQELEQTGFLMKDIEPQDQAGVLIAGDICAVLSEFTAMIPGTEPVPVIEGNHSHDNDFAPDPGNLDPLYAANDHLWHGRSLFALIDGPDKDHPFQIHIVALYGKDPIYKAELFDNSKAAAWSANDDLICICDSIKKK